jgi:cyclic pyranopterin phosphate synthase
MGAPPVSLRLSVTEQCQLRCVYCRPERDGHSTPAALLGARELVTFARLVDRHLGLGKVRITGGEPLLRRELVAIVHGLADAGSWDLALTTNGQRLAGLASELRKAGLRRLNISLDSLRADVFGALSRGGDMTRTLAGIDAALQAGFPPPKLNTVVMRGKNDDEVASLVDFALARGCELRFIELMATGLSLQQYEAWFVSCAEIRERLSESLSFEPLPVEPGASARRFRVRSRHGRIGVVGFIAPATEPFCASCRRLRLTSDGRLVSCLGKATSIPLAARLRALDGPEDAELAEMLRGALLRKRKDEPLRIRGLMSAVGG